jgi:hypothetical protein
MVDGIDRVRRKKTTEIRGNQWLVVAPGTQT